MFHRAIGGLALAFGLSACAVSTPLAITSTGQGLGSTSSVSLDSQEQPSSDRSRFGAALRSAFESRSIGFSADAPVLADFSVSQGDASAGVLAGKGEDTEDPDQRDWIATPRRSRSFDKCEAQRLRATLVLYDRASGAIIYRGSGEATECDFGQAEMAAMADGLVADALSKAPG